MKLKTNVKTNYIPIRQQKKKKKKKGNFPLGLILQSPLLKPGKGEVTRIILSTVI